MLVLSSVGEALLMGIRDPVELEAGKGGSLGASPRIGVASVELVAGRDRKEAMTRCSMS